MVKTAGLISVIIPIHNRGSLLRPCLDSVSAQTDKRIEVLLVDDGSTEALDDVYAYLRQTPSARLIVQPNQGLFGARNRGLNYVSGEFFFFVDSDDVLHPQTLVFCREALEREPQAAFVRTLVQTFKGDSPPELPWPPPTPVVWRNPLEDYLRLPNRDCLMSTACATLYRWSQVGAFRFSPVRYYEDVDFTFRVLRSTSWACFVNYPFYGYRDVEGSIVHRSIDNENLAACDTVVRNLAEVFRFEPKRWKAVCKRVLLPFVLVLLKEIKKRHDTESLTLRRIAGGIARQWFRDGIFTLSDFPFKWRSRLVYWNLTGKWSKRG